MPIKVYVLYTPDLQISSTQIQAKTRKLRAKWTMNAVHDLMSVHRMDSEEELKTKLMAEITQVDNQDIDMPALAAYLEDIFRNIRVIDNTVNLAIQKFIRDTYDCGCVSYRIYGLLKEIGFIEEVNADDDEYQVIMAESQDVNTRLGLLI